MTLRPTSDVLSYVVALLMLTVPALSAAADHPDLETLLSQGPEALLKRADALADPHSTVTREVRMTLKGGGDDGRELKMTIINGPKSRAALRFSYPADLKGLAVLMKGKNEMYIKLPGSKKVRRVASHARRQSFKGTDWSLDDLKTVRLLPDFVPTIASSDDTYINLTLERRENSSNPYEKLVTRVVKANLTIDRIDYFEGSERIKRQERTNLEPEPDGSTAYRSITMTDFRRDHATVLDVLKLDYKTKVPKKTFTKRWLIRGT